MNRRHMLSIYRVMQTARQVDRVSQEIIQRGEAFFHLSGAGHEASVALARHLTSDDWLHCHYRDKALLLARGLSIRSFFDGMLCKDASSSRGRRMSAFCSDRELNILSMVTPTGNNALQAVGVAEAVKDEASSPIVLCGIGDGTTQQGEVLEAIGAAVRDSTPVLFMIQDNRWAISTTTQGRTFYSLPDGEADSYCGLPIERLDGRDVIAVDQRLENIVHQMRVTRRPRIVVFEVERLDSHTNADDQRVYRSELELRQAAGSGDPIAVLGDRLLADGVDEDVLRQIDAEVVEEVAKAEAAAASGDDPITDRTAKRPVQIDLKHPAKEYRGDESQATLTMGTAIRDVLKHHLETDSRLFLYGQDIEDPKGDVLGVTKGLSTEFGGRVCNSALSESTIIGTSIGRALAGQKPVAFIQFADFLPLAYNQLTLELGNMHWRTDGAWQAPVVVMVACGGYRPGLGPYHAQTFESTMAQAPGLDVFMPSTATDAAGMLNAAFLSERPSVFLYPKAILNDPARATSSDVEDHFIPIGTAFKRRTGNDLTFVAWGNTVALCERAAVELEHAGVEAEIIDLRCLSPWDKKMVLASAEKTSRVIVVHEDNHTCGFGSEVIATVAEKSRFPVSVRRVTREDTYIPCNFANQLEILPSYRRVLAAAAEMLDFDLTWEQPDEPEDGMFDVPAIGSAPSDEEVLVIEFTSQVGSIVQRGDVVAEVEAAKSTFQITTPVSGEVSELCCSEGESIAVGRPLLRIHTNQSIKTSAPVIVEQPGEPKLQRRPSRERLRLPRRTDEPRAFEVGMSSMHAVTGNRVVSNDELLSKADMTSDDVVRLTGIASRNWADGGQDAINMAVQAALKTLDREGLTVDQLDLVICSTTSPSSVTPSMACQVLNGLVNSTAPATLQAFDINAACSGYLYALQSGYDYLQSKPDSRVLVVTTEVLSPLLDRSDLDTAILFGDAASATVLYGESHFENAKARLIRPELSAKGDDGSTLSVPFRDRGFIQMQGRKVFSEAVRSMISSLHHVCRREGLGMDDLKMIVPHQANQRILDAIQSRVNGSVYSNIRRFGNTSSTSIPLCLSEVLPAAESDERFGLCAFGGGFTFGAGIIESIE